MRDHREHEPAGDAVGHALHRRARALRLRDHLHDLREHGLRADLLGAHDQRAAGVHRRADQLVARRAWSPASARRSASIRRRALLPSMTTPSTGTFSPGRTRSESPTCTCASGTSSSLPSAAMRRAVFGARPSSDLIAAEVCERALQLEQLAEQRQRDDDRRRLEVDRRRAPSTRTTPGRRRGATVATTL